MNVNYCLGEITNYPLSVEDVSELSLGTIVENQYGDKYVIIKYYPSCDKGFLSLDNNVVYPMKSCNKFRIVCRLYQYEIIVKKVTNE